jgi:hypothetical protein
MISSGTLAIGHGGAGDRSVGGGSPWMERLVNSLMRDCKGAERPCREWWAVLGTVAEALEGLGSCGFGIDACAVDAGAGAVECFLPWALKYEGGKCLAL